MKVVHLVTGDGDGIGSKEGGGEGGFRDSHLVRRHRAYASLQALAVVSCFVDGMLLLR